LSNFLENCLPSKRLKNSALKSATKSNGYGWGGRDRTSVWRNQNPSVKAAISNTCDAVSDYPTLKDQLLTSGLSNPKSAPERPPPEIKTPAQGATWAGTRDVESSTTFADPHSIPVSKEKAPILMEAAR